MTHLKHLLTLEDMTTEWWDNLYARCRDIMANPDKYAHTLDGKLMATLFYEPSSRTQFSFQSAMMRLGGKVFGFSDPQTSSVAKGETIADTVRVVSSFADIVVIRSPVDGAAAEAAKYSYVPVINAGDGSHMHPTQTLADLTTIAIRRGKIGNMRVGLCGDLKYGRTVHSIVYALSKFSDIEFDLISPRGLSMPQYMIDFLNNSGIKYNITEDLDSAIPSLDILYMTRVQKERFRDPLEYEQYAGVYILNREKLSAAKNDMLVMHPLPRVDEIAYDVDDDPRAVYFEQVRNGMYIRMALLLDSLEL